LTIAISALDGCIAIWHCACGNHPCVRKFPFRKTCWQSATDNHKHQWCYLCSHAQRSAEQRTVGLWRSFPWLYKRLRRLLRREFWVVPKRSASTCFFGQRLRYVKAASTNDSSYVWLFAETPGVIPRSITSLHAGGTYRVAIRVIYGKKC